MNPNPLKIARRNGAALIIALAFLLLISAVVLAFLASSRNDRKSASSFANAQEAQRLSDTAVSVVMSQIRDATTFKKSSVPTSWASQPGMIRTYGTDGNLAQAFKLYSSDELAPVSFGSTEMNNETTAMANWNGQPAHFVDLNEAAIVPRPDPADPTKTSNATIFPIVDPRAAANAADGKPAVEGFSYTGPIPGVVTTAGAASDTQRLPMPVKWIYVLRDGSLIAPSAAAVATKTATLSGTVPTRANPITGRIAFWTDDDTSKVNINTASEGSFWDIPRSVALNEARMGWAIPVKGEFQAVAGHPATTSLSSVLGTLIGRPAAPLAPFPTTATDYTNYYAPYVGISPRTSDATTSGKRTTQAGSQQTTVGSVTGMGQPVVYDTERLYATTDELLFKPDRTSNATGITATELSRRDFFLTASSRAPETNLFGMPRISLWPFQRLPAPGGNNATQTPRDQLLAFCGKIGVNPYYFERASIAVGPGATSSASARSMTDDYATITRNQQLHTYLGGLLDKTVPGFGSKFTDKWSTAGNAQISTMTFDYLRSGMNLFQAPSGTRAGVKSWGYEVDVPQGQNQGGYVVPIKIGGKLGFGKETIITEAAMVFIATKVNPIDRITTEMQSFMVCNQYRPSPMSAASAVGIRFRVTSPFGINGTVRQKIRMGESNSGRNFAFPGVHQALWRNAAPGVPSTDDQPVGRMRGSNEDTEYALVSDPVAVTGQTFNFPGGNVTVEILEPDGPGVIQTLNMEFRAINSLPVPQAVNGAGDFSAVEARTFDERATAINSSNQNTHSIFRFGDIVKSVRFSGAATAPHKGDFRLLALKENVPATWFKPNASASDLPYGAQPVPYTFDTSGNALPGANANARAYRFVHSLRNDSWTLSNQAHYGWSDGKNGTALDRGMQTAALVAGFNNNLTGNAKVLSGGLISTLQMGTPSTHGPTPVVPQGHLEALNKSGGAGDFTSNYGFCADGATIAIPDFGTLQTISDGGYFTGMTWSDDKGDAGEPNRQAPSPIVFGTLPSVDSSGDPAPWQTLLFCSNPSAGNTHPGFGTGASGVGPAARAPFTILPDHLFLDLWWMPAVDPYAVSEPLSTAGKVNLNYQIAPFTYINRSTGIQALMKSVKLAGVPDANSTNYKQNGNGQNAWNTPPQTPFSNVPVTTRFNLNLSDTDGSLQGFTNRFAAGDIFRSASEVCTIPLVPTGETTSTLTNWWSTRRLTGDNLRESPYNALYSRVTTKSNTYTVHYRVQTLKQVSTGGRNWAEWTEGKDQVVGEYRGATTIERFLDTNEPGIPDYATAAATTDPIDKFYRFRVLSTRQFAP